jgi:hypothetical protein
VFEYHIMYELLTGVVKRRAKKEDNGGGKQVLGAPPGTGRDREALASKRVDHPGTEQNKDDPPDDWKL